MLWKLHERLSCISQQQIVDWKCKQHNDIFSAKHRHHRQQSCAFEIGKSEWTHVVVARHDVCNPPGFESNYVINEFKMILFKLWTANEAMFKIISFSFVRRCIRQPWCCIPNSFRCRFCRLRAIESVLCDNQHQSHFTWKHFAICRINYSSLTTRYNIDSISR